MRGDDYEGKVKLNLGGSSRTIGDTSFIFLEQVVSHLDSKVVELEEVTLKLTFEEGFVERALVSQLSRQQAELKFLKIGSALGLPDSFLFLIGKSSSWSVKSLSFLPDDVSAWRRLAEVSKKGEISSLEVDEIIGCAETVRKVWLATEIMHIDRLPDTYVRTHGLIWNALISREEGESGWARILEFIAARNEMATRKRKRGVEVKRQKKNKT